VAYDCIQSNVLVKCGKMWRGEETKDSSADAEMMLLKKGWILLLLRLNCECDKLVLDHPELFRSEYLDPQKSRYPLCTQYGGFAAG
jgi:hypothetical protein